MREEQLPPDGEVVELAPNIRRLQLPMNMPGLGHVNCYILDDERGAALVDPGLPGPGPWKALMAGLKAAEVPPERVHTLIVTHSHPDHFGSTGRFAHTFGAELVTHRSFRLWWDTNEADDDPLEEVDALGENDEMLEELSAANGHDPGGQTPERGDAIVGRFDRGPLGPTPWGGKGYNIPWHRRLAMTMMRKGWGGRMFRTPEPTSRLDDADRITLARREFVAVHTPGHTVDHLCLFDPEGGVMICGDHVLPTITPHISGMTTARDPLHDFFTSLDRVADFDGVQLGLPAHGQPFTDLAGRVDDIKRHHIERLDLLRASSDRLGSADVASYMRELFKERAWGPMAESETFAHLEHLRICGEAQVARRSDGKLAYEFV